MSETEITSDAFLAGRLTIRQFAQGFRSGMDAVVLASACPAKPGDQVLEAGCGTGVALLCVGIRVSDCHLTGIEIDSATANLAKNNVDANNLAVRCQIVTGDITAPWTTLYALGLRQYSYHHCIANPPYYDSATNRMPSNQHRQRANVMDAGGLDTWVRFLTGVTKPGGTATIIYPAQSLHELLNAMAGRFGGLQITPIYTKPGPALRVLVCGTQGSRAPSALSRGLILHDANGKPSEAAERILRYGDAMCRHELDVR